MFRVDHRLELFLCNLEDMNPGLYRSVPWFLMFQVIHQLYIYYPVYWIINE